MTDEEGILQKFVKLEYRYYCPYCGKELEREEEYDDHEIYVYRFCNCDDAKKEREIMHQIRELEKRLPEVKYEVKPQVTRIRRPWDKMGE
ncbi:MAG: hypothetical protein J6Y37_13970 [Paludibacteraceae bacterium]|nr:hypothetical protein [Paludibacteraceae bacterium]